MVQDAMDWDCDLHGDFSGGFVHGFHGHCSDGEFHIQFRNVVGIFIVCLVEMEASRDKEAVQSSIETARFDYDVFDSVWVSGGCDGFYP